PLHAGLMQAFARRQAAGKGGYPMKPLRSRLDLLLVSAVIAFAFSMATPSGAVVPRRLGGESLRRTHESAAPGPSTFASVNKPLGIAVTTDRVLVTQFNTDKRSEERRVGKECRSGGGREREKE